MGDLKMNAFIKLLIYTITIFLFASNSFSTPLSGTYTIGSGGNYPTINSSFSDAVIKGIDGPVIFDVITGVYNEYVIINRIPGSNPVNTITLRSQSGNPADVIINGNQNVIYIKGASDLIFDKLTFNSSASSRVSFYGHNLYFTNNNFNYGSIVNTYEDLEAVNINISGNQNIQSINFYKRFGLDDIKINIAGNSISALVKLVRFSQVRIEKNTIGNGLYCNYFTGDILKNKISGNVTIFPRSTAFFYNNFILGDIYFRYADCTLKHNTIVGGTLNLPTLTMDHPTFKFLNNIFINPAGGQIISSITTSPGSSDYNVYYNFGNNIMATYNGVTYNSLNTFFTGTGLEEYSINKNITFKSPNDLHLFGNSIGDNQLGGIPELLIPDDIDGETRSVTRPYMGADEPDFPLPVELASFTSSASNNNVKLNWTTASEINNSGFDVERSNVNGQWSKVNFVKGLGNSTTPNNYSYEDKNLSSGKYKYRLKQIDFNGNFEYFNLSNEVEIEVPEKFSLSQNYPNPFNPTTKISYELRVTNYVFLIVYDLNGKEVITLVSENQNAGRYDVEFNGSNLASGVYFYKLDVGSLSGARDFTAVKKMSLIK